MLNDGLLMVLLLLNALALATLYNYSSNQTAGTLRATSLLNGMAYSLLIMPVLLRFFPGFQLKATFISPQYPQRKWLIALLDLIIMGFLKTRNTIYFLSVLVFFFFSRGLPPGTLAKLFLFLTIGILMGESLLNAISWRIYFHLFTLVTLLIILFFGKLFHDNFNTSYMNIVLVAITFVLICFYFLFYTIQFETREGFSTSTSKSGILFRKMIHGYPYLLILLKNKSFVIVLTVGMLFKLLIMASFMIHKGNTLSEIIDRAPFIMCLIMPVILFTYIYNNLWGYLYPVALNNLLSGSSAKQQIRIYLYFIAPALMLDFLVTFAALSWGHMLEPKIIFSYLVVTALCVPIGIISSFRKYFFVLAGLDFNRIRGKTSRLFSFSLIVPAMLLGFLYNEGLLLDAALLLIGITSITLFIYINNNIHSLMRKFKLDFFN